MAGLQGLTYRDWSTRTGRQGQAPKDRSIWTWNGQHGLGQHGLANTYWPTWTGPQGLAHKDWPTGTGPPGTAHRLQGVANTDRTWATGQHGQGSRTTRTVPPVNKDRPTWTEPSVNTDCATGQHGQATSQHGQVYKDRTSANMDRATGQQGPGN